jgi:hypothetical protein
VGILGTSDTNIRIGFKWLSVTKTLVYYAAVRVNRKKRLAVHAHDSRRHDIQHNDTQHNDAQHNGLNCDAQFN